MSAPEGPRKPVEEASRHPKAPVPKARTPGPFPLPPKERRTGLVIVNTGNGKGKTTADLVSEMREVKHPYRTRGLGAQPGIEL